MAKPRKKRSPFGSVQKLGPGHYRLRVTVGYDPATGKQIRPTKTVRCSEKEAYEELARLAHDAGQVTGSTYAKMSVADFCEHEYMRFKVEHDAWAETTRQGNEKTFANYIRPLFSNVTVADAAPLYIADRLKRIEAPGARLNAYKLLRGVFNFAVDEARAIEVNPVKKSMKPQLPKYSAQVYSLEQLAVLYEFVRGSSIEAGILVAATTAARRSEVCGLDWSDLTLEHFRDADGTERWRGEVRILKGYHTVKLSDDERGRRIMKETKTERSERAVALPAFAVRRLIEIRGTTERIGPLMVDSTGQRMTPDGFTRRWRRLMKARYNKAGETIYKPPLPFIELKNLRHSVSTVLLAQGATLQQVSQMDGHSVESTTDLNYNRTDYLVADHRLAALLDQGVACAQVAS